MNRLWTLSESKILIHQQCPRWLWLESHKPDQADVSVDTQAAFMVGNTVGELARKEHRDGILIEKADSFAAATVLTLETIGQRVPVFEAAFEHKQVRIRSDLLLPLPRSWHLAEVKSAGEVKDYYLNDLAVQSSVLKDAGVRVSRSSVRHVNKEFVYRGGGNYRGLLMDADSTADVKALSVEVPNWVSAARCTLNGAEPATEMGSQCNHPWGCPFQAYCQKKAGPQPAFPVELLPYGKKLAAKLREEGYKDLRRVPADRMTNELCQRIHRTTRTNKAYLDGVGARQAVGAWKYPRAYLDFETINPAVPIWEGIRPFQHVPFQYSCDIEQADGSVTHREFLDLSGKNPARTCAERLIKDLRGCKTIIAYSAGMERGVIERLADAFADLRQSLLGLSSRVVDLLPVVRNNYYHRDMLGSYSMKAVLPTVTPVGSYADLDGVADGRAAQYAYCEAIAPDTTDERREELQGELLRYCALDSEGMIQIVKHLTQ